MKKLIFLSILGLNLHIYCQTPPLIPQKHSIDILDCECSSFNNPLKGINKFTVLINDKSKDSNAIIQELKKIGETKEFSFADSNGINFEGMGTGARLMFNLTPLSVTGESKEEIFRISLSLSMSIEVLKTKNRIDSYVWTANAFSSKASTDEAAKKIARQFIAYYKEANPKVQPLFYIYQ